MMKRLRHSIGWGVVLLAAGVATSARSQDADSTLPEKNLTLRPSVSARGVYNSNLDATPNNEKDDYSTVLELGLDFENCTRLLTIDGSFWLLAEEYLDYTDRAHQDFGNRLGVRLWDRESLLVAVDERYEDRTASDVVTGSIEGRKECEASVLMGKHLTDELDGDLAYRYRDVQYDAERLYDWSQHAADLVLGHDMTERTIGTLLLRAGRQSSDGNINDANFGVVHLGVKTRSSSKVAGAIGAGWHYHDVEPAISTPSADARLTWRPREQLAVALSVLRTVEPALQERENYNTPIRTSLGLHYSPVKVITVSAIGMHARNDYTRPVTVGGVKCDKRDDTWTWLLRCAYRPSGQRLELFAETKSETRDSTLASNDYDLLVMSLGARYQY